MIDPPGVSIAGVYEHWLAGHNTYLAERSTAEKITKLAPQIPAIAGETRHFLNRAALYIAARGVSDFLNIGPGFPTPPTIPQTLRLVCDQPRVLSIDSDLRVVSHTRVQLANGDGCGVLHGDLNDLDSILGHAEVRQMLDRGRQVGLLLGAVLHFVRDAPTVVAELKRALPPGSYMAISHGIPDTGLEGAAQFFSERVSPLYLRQHNEIETLFDGFQLVGQGVTPVNVWHAVPTGESSPVLGGVARKPGRL